MSRTIQANDESRGPGVTRNPDLRMGERRAGQSQPRAVQSAGARGGPSRSIICLKCDKPGHISRNCPEGRTRPTPFPKGPNPKNGAIRER